MNDIPGEHTKRNIEIINSHKTDSLTAMKDIIDSFDLLVIGIKERKHFYNKRLIPAQEKIAHLSNKPLILVKKSRGLSSLTKRWF